MLTNADVLIIQLGRAIAIVAQAAVLTVLASSVVFAADAGHHVQEVNVAAAVGVAVALAVWTSQVGETPVISEHLGGSRDTEKGIPRNIQERARSIFGRRIWKGLQVRNTSVACG